MPYQPVPHNTEQPTRPTRNGLIFGLLALVLACLPLVSFAGPEDHQPARRVEQLLDDHIQAEPAAKLSNAKVVIADYTLILRDFPMFANLNRSTFEAYRQRSPNYQNLSDRELRYKIIDEWLLSQAGFIAVSQLAGNEVNTIIPTERERKTAYRMSELWVDNTIQPRGRQLVFPAFSVLEGQTNRQVGLIEGKGFGSPNPRQKSHRNGLFATAEALREFLFDKLVNTLFRYSKSKYRSIGSYAVLDFGFNIVQADGKRVRAGAILRQAESRSASMGSMLSDEITRDVELTLRRYGVTSAGAFRNDYDFDRLNIQGDKNGVRINDFGTFRILPRFDRQVKNFSGTTDLISRTDPNFIQPDSSFRVPDFLWGSKGENPDIFPKYDEAYKLAYDLMGQAEAASQPTSRGYFYYFLNPVLQRLGVSLSDPEYAMDLGSSTPRAGVPQVRPFSELQDFSLQDLGKLLTEEAARIPELQPLWQWMDHNKVDNIYLGGGLVRGLLLRVLLRAQSFPLKKMRSLPPLHLYELQIGNGNDTDFIGPYEAIKQLKKDLPQYKDWDPIYLDSDKENTKLGGPTIEKLKINHKKYLDPLQGLASFYYGKLSFHWTPEEIFNNVKWVTEQGNSRTSEALRFLRFYAEMEYLQAEDRSWNNMRKIAQTEVFAIREVQYEAKANPNDERKVKKANKQIYWLDKSLKKLYRATGYDLVKTLGLIHDANLLEVLVTANVSISDEPHTLTGRLNSDSNLVPELVAKLKEKGFSMMELLWVAKMQINSTASATAFLEQIKMDPIQKAGEQTALDQFVFKQEARDSNFEHIYRYWHEARSARAAGASANRSGTANRNFYENPGAPNPFCPDVLD